MDDWEKFNDSKNFRKFKNWIKKTSLPEKEDFYSHLNIEDITNADYEHVKIVCKDFLK